MTAHARQWGGRFAEPPDPLLHAYGSSLEDDLILAAFDVRCSHAHVEALLGGGIVSDACAAELHAALDTVQNEIASGAFASFARGIDAEDVHGAIDARVRELCTGSDSGRRLHAGRSRNDQVATTLALYARDRSAAGVARSRSIAEHLLARARGELEAGTLLAGSTHWQPAQPVLLAFWLAAAAESFVRGAERFERARAESQRFCPLGSAAIAGSSLPLDRDASAGALGFGAPSTNAMASVGSRDTLLDVSDAFVRTAVDASRVASELVIWCAPAFAYARAGDRSSTGSSAMPQKRNPDPFELVRGGAAELLGYQTGALASLCGLALSYHRDLQQTKRLALQTIERGIALLAAFELALRDLSFDRARMGAAAGSGYTVATDVADMLVNAGIDTRRAHYLVGASVAAAEAEGRDLDDVDLAHLASSAGIAPFAGPLDPRDAVAAKRTAGSTAPDAVRDSLETLARRLAAVGAS
jgi:argininosuccinate lyase